MRNTTQFHKAVCSVTLPTTVLGSLSLSGIPGSSFLPHLSMFSSHSGSPLNLCVAISFFFFFNLLCSLYSRRIKTHTNICINPPKFPLSRYVYTLYVTHSLTSFLKFSLCSYFLTCFQTGILFPLTSLDRGG